jgi:hypothetical protein
MLGRYDILGGHVRIRCPEFAARPSASLDSVPYDRHLNVWDAKWVVVGAFFKRPYVGLVLTR